MPNLPLDGVRSRLLLLVVLALIPSSVLALVYSFRSRGLLQVRYRDQALQMAQQAVSKQSSLVLETRDLLQELATRSDIKTTNCNKVLGTVLEQSPQFASLGLVSTSGSVLCSALPLTRSITVRDRAWFQRVMRGRDFAAGDYQIGRISGQPSLALAYPVFDRIDRIEGAIVASLKLTWLNQTIALKDLPLGSTISVIDRRGVILGHYPDPDRWVGQSIQDTVLFRELKKLHEESTTLEAQGIDGTDQLFAVSTLLPQQTPDLRVLISIPQREILAQADRDVLHNFVWLGAMTLTALVLASVFSTIAIQRPLEELMHTAQRLAKGDLQARISEPFQPGLFGRLACGFNAMADALESQLAERSAIAKSQEAAEVKERFAAMVSHEFRNPLCSIQLAAEMLRHYGDRMSPTQIEEQFERLLSAVRHMTQLMEDVLLLSQEQAGVIEFLPVPMNPIAFCGSLLTEFQRSISDQHRLIFVSEGVCEQANLDEKLLRSILTNLLSNAIKYSPNGGIVQLTLVGQERSLIFRVQDQGIGIQEADLPRLFESFHRGENVGRIQGTGLGLTIVKRCVDLHQGEINVDSIVNVGTIVTVTLPR